MLKYHYKLGGRKNRSYLEFCDLISDNQIIINCTARTPIWSNWHLMKSQVYSNWVLAGATKTYLKWFFLNEFCHMSVFVWYPFKNKNIFFSGNIYNKNWQKNWNLIDTFPVATLPLTWYFRETTNVLDSAKKTVFELMYMLKNDAHEFDRLFIPWIFEGNNFQVYWKENVFSFIALSSFKGFWTLVPMFFCRLLMFSVQMADIVHLSINLKLSFLEQWKNNNSL